MPRRAVETMQRDAEALRMHLAGMSYWQIATQMGWRSHTAALQAVRRAIADSYRLPAADAVKAEEERLDLLTRTLTRLAADPAQEPQTVIQASMALLRVSESRRKLLGLDQPARQRIEVVDDAVVGQVVAVVAAKANEAEQAHQLAIEPPRLAG